MLKKIRVIDTNDSENAAMVGSQEEYKDLLASHGVVFLIDHDTCEIYGFPGLADSGDYYYKLGPRPRQQQQHLWYRTIQRNLSAALESFANFLYELRRVLPERAEHRPGLLRQVALRR